MGYIDFGKLKARVPITGILEHFGLLQAMSETPQGYAGTCPFCGGHAFKVNTEKNVWFCFGECKTKGELNGGNILAQGKCIRENGSRTDRRLVSRKPSGGETRHFRRAARVTEGFASAVRKGEDVRTKRGGRHIGFDARFRDINRGNLRRRPK